MNDAAGPALIGWQTLLADLALILFMVTAAAMSTSVPSRSRSEHSSASPAAADLPSVPPSSEPLAVWRAGGSQTLERWLAGEQPDARQQLTITAHYRPGSEPGAAAAAQALIGQAGAMGKAARVIIAPAPDDEVLASLAYDRPPDAGTAQGLLSPAGNLAARTLP